MSVRDDYVASIKTAFVTLGKALAMSYIVAEVPFLGLPVIRSIVGFTVEKILSVVVNSTEMGAYFVYTDFRVNAQGHDFILAAMENHKIQASGTPEEKAASERKLFEKFTKFVVISA